MRPSQRGVWMATAVVALCAVLGGVYGNRVQATVAGGSDIQQAVQNFTKVYAIIEQNYADPIDPERVLFQGAIPGMLRSLDPHSGFFDPRAFSLLREDQSGHYYGVGIGGAAGRPHHRAGAFRGLA